MQKRRRKLLGLFVATNLVAPRLIDWVVAGIRKREETGGPTQKLIGRALETVGMPLFKPAWFYFNTIQLNTEIQSEIDELRDACHLPPRRPQQ